jgi:hypothetical protein
MNKRFDRWCAERRNPEALTGPTATRRTVETMADPRYFLLDGPEKRLLKVEDATGYVWRDGGWSASEAAYRRATGIGGDSDAAPITAEEAEAFMKSSLDRFGWSEKDLASGGVTIT